MAPKNIECRDQSHWDVVSFVLVYYLNVFFLHADLKKLYIVCLCKLIHKKQVIHQIDNRPLLRVRTETVWRLVAARSGFAVVVTEEQHCRIPEGNAYGRRKNPLFQMWLHFKSSDLSETNVYGK